MLAPKDQPRYPHIDLEPEVMGGLPVIRGTRISVYSVAARLADGDSLDDLCADYPTVPAASFDEAASYARSHPRRDVSKRFR